MNNKVYCKDCIYFFKNYKECLHPNNVNFGYSVFRYIALPRFSTYYLNKYNRCLFFKRKWWKIWIPKIKFVEIQIELSERVEEKLYKYAKENNMNIHEYVEFILKNYIKE